MGMRDYHDLKDIIIPEAQEKIMDIYCAAWDDCRDMGHCKDCPDRQMLKEKFSLLECFSLKYSRMLIEAGYAPVVHGAWEEHCEEDGFVHHRCSKCRKNAFYEYKTIPLYEEDNDGEIVDCGVMKLDIIEQLTSFCPHCGAKMDEEEKHDPKG